MKATLLIKSNIDTLLRARGQSRKDLATWCYKSESWISKIFKEPRREFSLRDVDRIADFFGIATYQLLQPGISSLTERRMNTDRRSARDRRIGHAQRAMMTTAADLDAHRPQRKGSSHVDVVASSPILDALQRLTADYERRLSALISQAESGRQAPNARRALPSAPARRRGPSRSDAAKT